VMYSPTDRKHGPIKRKRAPGGGGAILLLAGGAAFTTLLSIFGPTIFLVEQHHSQSKDVRVGLESLSKVVRVADLKHEEIFRLTIKSCLPTHNPKCKQYIPPTSGKDEDPIQREALVAPPGDISSILMNQLERIQHQHTNLQNKTESDIEVFATSHVPPYGYGKTHGWTKIVRLVPRALVLEVVDALQSSLLSSDSHMDLTLDDLKAALRQILRFHCRLSHVAAHTALLSIPLVDLIANSANVSRHIQDFLVSRDVGRMKGGDDDGVENADDDSGSVSATQEFYGSQMLTYIQSVAHVDVLKVLDEVLIEEMNLSRNMTVWPCLSFWAAGEREDPSKLTRFTQNIAKELSPECSDPFVSCFVPRDICEASGNGVCKGHKR
jgi:hypothetical protein